MLSDDLFPIALVFVIVLFLGGLLFVAHTNDQNRRACAENLAKVEPLRPANDIITICR